MLSLLSIVAPEFFLGMRYATDPDHVIAVTTIVARHRMLKRTQWAWAAVRGHGTKGRAL
jgi:high-affinity nickel permease